VPAGQTVTATYLLTGTLSPGPGYQLTLAKQATVASDRVQIALHGTRGWSVVGPETLTAQTTRPIVFTRSLSR